MPDGGATPGGVVALVFACLKGRVRDEVALQRALKSRAGPTALRKRIFDHGVQRFATVKPARH